MHCSNGLPRMKAVASEGTSRSFTVWRKCVLSQLIMGFVHDTLLFRVRYPDRARGARARGRVCYILGSTSHRCQHQRTKKRDRADEKAGVINFPHHQREQL